MEGIVVFIVLISCIMKVYRVINAKSISRRYGLSKNDNLDKIIHYKNGAYCRWQGKEYRIISINDCRFLSSNTKLEGFKYDKNMEIYIRQLPEQITEDDIYSVLRKGEYKGVEVIVGAEIENKYLIMAESIETGKSLDFYELDEGCYQYWAYKKDVTNIREESK